MSPHQIIAVGVRLFAVWLAVNAVGSALGVMEGAGDGDGSPAAPMALVLVAVLALVAAALWFFPLTIARKLLSAVPGATPAPERARPAESVWIAAGCTLIGLWLLSRSLPALASYLIVVWHFRIAVGGSAEVAERLWYLSLEIGFAVWLLVGAPGLRALLSWARRAGLRPSE